MPGLAPFLPSLELPAFVCRNCGYWQRHFETPHDCPLCMDARHVLPPKGYQFYSHDEAIRAFPMHWEEMLPGLWHFWNDPVDGIGSHSYLVQHEIGNILFEGATVYSQDALNLMKSLGGVYCASASHPHTYGALWQIQDCFDTNVALHPADLNWTNALRVTHPFDEALEFAPDLRLIHAGVHFTGQSFLHDASRGVLFCGDALKFDLDPVNSRHAISISSHKSFVRSVPLTPRETMTYQKIFRSCVFEKTFTPFEQVYNVNHLLVDKFLIRLKDQYPQPNFIPIDSL